MDATASKLRYALLTLVAVAAIGVVASVVWVSGTWRHAVWTNGGAISVPAEIATPREILWSPPELIPTGVAPGLDAYEPRLNWDGSRLLFAVGRPRVRDAVSTIWSMARTPDGWTGAAPVAALESASNTLGAEPSRDDRAIYFSSDRAGGFGGFDLWVIRRDDVSEGVWSEPANLGPSVNSAFDEYSPALTPDGDRLFFATNRPPAGAPAINSTPRWSATVREGIDRTGFDLYSAPMTDGALGDAAPIDAINTPANEGTPSVSPFGDYLYFASDRAGGAGGFDLHRVRLRAGGGFGRVERCGDQINTAFNELDPGLAMGGHELVFSSDRPEPGTDRGRIARLYRSTAREVYLERAPAGAALGWLWWLLWLLMLLFALLLLLFLLRRLMTAGWSGRMRKVGLLAQCLLLSLLVHALLMLALTVWQITASVGDSLRGSGATKVALTTSAGAQSSTLASQLMSTMVGVDIEPPEFESISPASISIPAPATTPMQHRSSPIPLTTDASPIPLDPIPQDLAPPLSITLKLPEPGSTHPPVDPRPAPATLATPAVEPAMRSADPAVEVASRTPRQREREPAQLPGVLAQASAPPPDVSITTPPAADSSPMPIPEMAPVETRPGPIERTIAASPTPAPVSAGDRVEVELPEQEHAATSDDPAEMRIGSDPPVESSRRRPTLDASAGAPVAPPKLPVPIEVQRPDASRSPVDPASLQAPEAALTAPSMTQSQDEFRRMPEAVDVTAALTLDLPSEAPEARQAPSADAPELEILATAPIQREHGAAPVGAIGRQVDSATAQKPSLDASLLDARVDPNSVFPDINLAPSDPRLDRPVASLNLPIETPAITPSLPAISIPTEVAPPVDAFTQRDEAVREDVVEAMGGSKKTERAVAMAMDWLARRQSADGRWDSDDFDPSGREGGRSRVDCDVAVTGLALLVFLGADQTHTTEGPYRDHVERGLRWLLTNQSNSGDIRNGETMYSQGIATIALCEAFGMTGDARLRDPAQRAIGFIAKAQGADHGWRYEPGMAGDTSVLGWQVMAMVSARKVGLDVPPGALDGARAWLDQVSRPGAPGLYAYQRHKAPTLSMTAEGMFVQQLLGADRESPRMIQSAAFIGRHTPDWDVGARTYAWYYATLALFQRQGAEWERWNRVLATELINAQRKGGTAEGSWDPADQWSRVGGRVYQTAICALSLEVYYRYLPLYITKKAPTPGNESGLIHR